MTVHNPAAGTLITIWPRVGEVQVSRGRTAFVSQPDGEITPECSAEGLYIYNTRVLSRYAWRMNGKKPQLSCCSKVEQSSWIGYYIQTPENCRETPTHECDPLLETIELRLIRSVGEGMHEDVQLTNHTQISTTVKLDLEFEHQFVSQDEVKFGRRQRGRFESRWTHPAEGVWEQMTDYRARHRYHHQGDRGVAALHRGVMLRVENAGSPPRCTRKRISFAVHLAPHAQWRACLSWIGFVDGRRLPLASKCSLVESSDWDRRRARFLQVAARILAPGAHLPNDDLTSTVNRILHRSKLDLADLRLYDLDTDGGFALAAGVPSYIEVFGRDMLASSWQSSMLGPELLTGSLNVLKNAQTSDDDAWRDAQPGRIPHQIYTDPLSMLNFRPTGRYYGSVSSCLLFPIVLSELWHWTADLPLVRKYVNTALRAMEWADKHSLDSTGFYRYKTRSTQGVKNQGWKDSGDAIVYDDGSQVPAPIGTCEMQAFAYVAKLHFSEVLWWLKEVDLARKLHREAEDLKARFNEKFWMEDEGYFAMGIGPRGELIRSVGSDPGHCLLSGIVDESRVKRVAQRMLRDDLFSGWGVRTLSSLHPAFNPFSYHRGSVWPVENAPFVLAFARYGLHGEMHQLARAILESAALFDHHRLPEVFGGHQRTSEAPFPGMYREANSPQAWSASAPFSILQALVGIYPYAPAHVMFLDPRLPQWLPEITVEGLRIGKARVSVRFFRTRDGETSYQVLDLHGPLHVIHQPSPWSVTSGWAERVRDAVESLIPHRQAS